MEPSLKMQRLMKRQSVPAKTHNLRLEEIPEGESAQFSYNEISLSVLRATAYRAGKKMGCKFSVVTHKEHSCYEVGRIPNASN